MKKKVAIVINTFDLGMIGHRGVSSYLNKFLPSLAKACILDVYCFDAVQTEHPLFNKIITIPREQLKDPDFLKNSDYHFVFADYYSKHYYNAELRHSHSPMYRENIVRTPFELFVKKIFDRGRLVTKEQQEIYKKNLAKLDIMIANSEIARKDYIEFGGISPDNVFVLTPCIETPRDFSFLPQKNFTFGVSAVTFALKGGYTFLNALFRLKKHHKDFRAKIVYPNHTENTLLKFYVWLLGLQKNIEFLPFQPDMTNFYNSIYCLVVPSREETFGMVVLEAMANSRPVIVSSRCGAVDIIKEGENGWVFDYENNPDKSLYLSLKRVLDTSDDLEQISKNAYLTARKHNIDYHSEKLAEIIQKVRSEV